MKKILFLHSDSTLLANTTSFFKNKKEYEVDIYDNFEKAMPNVVNGKYDIAISHYREQENKLNDSSLFLLEHKIPTIISIQNLSSTTFDSIYKHSILDTVIEDTPSYFEDIIEIIERYYFNASQTVLVVDDQRSKRFALKNILTSQNFQIMEAASGEEALEQIKLASKVPDLALIDYNMGGMDGFQLCKEIRKSHSKNKFALIGVSSSEHKYITSLFMKSGANDFIYFPFSTNEFISRVNQNIDRIHHFKEIENIAFKDYLTGLYNRRYFFEAFSKLMGQVKRKNLKLSLAMIDIDFFKKVNDNYGHDAGDVVIQELANTLTENVRDVDLIGRLGGEEFAIVFTHKPEEDLNKIVDKMESIRLKVSELKVKTTYEEIQFTISIGMTIIDEKNTSDYYMQKADLLLYQAKAFGRNQIIHDIGI